MRAAANEPATAVVPSIKTEQAKNEQKLERPNEQAAEAADEQPPGAANEQASVTSNNEQTADAYLTANAGTRPQPIDLSSDDDEKIDLTTGAARFIVAEDSHLQDMSVEELELMQQELTFQQQALGLQQKKLSIQKEFARRKRAAQ